MRVSLVTTIFFLLHCFNNYSQDISSVLNHNRKGDVRSNSEIEDITINSIFFDVGKTKYAKKIIVLNHQLMETTLLEYDADNKIISRTSTQYDVSGTRSLVSKFERFFGEQGYSSGKEFYEYNTNGNLVEITSKDRTDNALKKTDVIYDSEGNPSELHIKTTFLGGATANSKISDNSPHREVIETIRIPRTKLQDSALIKFNALGDIVKDGDTEYE